MDGITVWVDRPSSRERDDDQALLTASELQLMRRLVQPADQDRFSAAWALARETLGGLLGTDPRLLRFDRSCSLCGHGTHGKPRLVGASLQFSIAHAEDRVLVAVADRIPVGVDVEPANAPTAEVADLVRHPSERDDGVGLVRLLVRKEAILKVTGHGLVRPMTGIVADPAPDGLVVTDLSIGQDYVAAVAAASDGALDVKVRSGPTGSRCPQARRAQSTDPKGLSPYTSRQCSGSS